MCEIVFLCETEDYRLEDTLSVSDELNHVLALTEPLTNRRPSDVHKSHSQTFTKDPVPPSKIYYS